MSFIMVSIPALLSAIIILLKIILVAPHLETQSQSICRDQNNNKLICDLEEMKLKIAKLESILEESVRSLSSNVNYLEEKGKLVEEMPHKIDFLKTALTNLKVQLLWAASRKNNFDILILESKAHDAEVRLEAVTKKVEKVKTIVTEQWIQIRQLDQALQVIEVRTSKIQKKKGYTINTFLKFFKDSSTHGILKAIRAPTLFSQDSSPSSYISQAQRQCKRIMAAVQRYHYELQRYLKQEMERNEFTATLAHPEVVFFLASALITFPLLGAWIMLLSHFSH